MTTAGHVIAAAGAASPEDALAVALATAARLPGAAARTDLERIPAAIAYRAQADDTLDSIAHRRYGSVAATLHVLAANPDLVVLGPHLPAGTLVALPDIDVDVEQPLPVIQIWD